MHSSLIRGQTILEILIGSSLVVVVLLAGVVLTTKSIQMSEAAAAREKAIQLAREGVEEARKLRNERPWSMFIALNPSPETILGKTNYTREIQILPLPLGDPDHNRLCNISVTVSWIDVKGSHMVDQKTVLTNW